jgi:riboflavin transporter FmnP
MREDGCFQIQYVILIFDIYALALDGFHLRACFYAHRRKNIAMKAEEMDMEAYADTNVRKKSKMTTKNMILVAMMGAISMVLMMFDFSVPFAPSFLKMDISDLPVILATFMMGPMEGILTAVIKIALKLLIKGTETAFVGEIANIIGAVSYLLPAAAVYHFKKGKTGAVLALTVGTLVVSITSIFGNLYLTFPAFSKIYGLPMETIIAMGTAVNKNITDLFTMMLFAVFPFNLFKYGILSVLTFLVYKRLKHILFR